MAGKGSTQRPTDMAAYSKNYDRIFGKKNEQPEPFYEDAENISDEMALHQQKMERGNG